MKVTLDKFRQIFWMVAISILLILFFLYLKTNQFSIHRFGDYGLLRINKITGVVEIWSLTAAEGWQNVTTKADMEEAAKELKK